MFEQVKDYKSACAVLGKKPYETYVWYRLSSHIY